MKRKLAASLIRAAVLLTFGSGITLLYLRFTGEPAARRPDLDALYSRAAMHDVGDRNPVIVIPGFLGSKLVDAPTGRTVWGAFGGDAVDPRNAKDAAILAFPMQQGVPIEELQDGVRVDGVLDSLRINIVGLSTEQSAYLNILRTLGVGGYRDDELGKFAIDYGDRHFTCFQFGYDWRKDIATLAVELDEFIESRAEYIRKERLERFGVDRPVKFDIVAHSMGGLIARYYLRHGSQPLMEVDSDAEVSWAGAERVEQAILVGTPNGGSVKSARALIEGVKLLPLLPSYNSGLIGTFPSIYALLPRFRHCAIVDEESGAAIDLLNAEEWETREWGLLDPDHAETLAWLLPEATPAERRTIARDHLQKCLTRTSRLHELLDAPAKPPEGLAIHLFAGDAVETQSAVSVAPDGALTIVESAPGDSTVTRASALLDERGTDGLRWTPRLRSPIAWSSARFLFKDHFGLTEDSAFVDNALYLLLEAPRQGVPDLTAETPIVGESRSTTPPMMKKDFMPAVP